MLEYSRDSWNGPPGAGSGELVNYCLKLFGGSIVALLAALLCGGCQYLQGPRAGSSGLKPGLNYMQPLKWRITYKYRVQEIVPNRTLAKKRESALYPGVPAVGKGTYEVWFVGPYDDLEVRGVKQVYASPEPTKVSPGKGKDSELTWYYYDFAPDGYLPQELEATISWEFITFERYTFWDGIEKAGYDKQSELYKRYTKEESPILFHPGLTRELQKMVKDIPETEVQQRAAICYNHLLQNFSYDYDQLWMGPVLGYEGMTPSTRAWENRHGVCDEISNVYCSMLRSIGIPARPCAGMVHDARTGRVMMGGGHAWSEFYMPNVGWVPVDATWGADTTPIEAAFSPMGAKRKIPHPDYYFGKADPYRITLVKDWNTALQPPPKTPKAEPVQSWFVAQTHRRSGINKIISGYEPMPGMSSGGKGWLRSESAAENNFDMEVELLGPPSQAELDPLIKQIQEGGAHFINVPLGIGKNYPVITTEMELPDPTAS
ncbi:transglutaminase domain-containing protein [bacterium]|nr:transglutaminase domain-containing protein [bacterium]